MRISNIIKLTSFLFLVMLLLSCVTKQAVLAEETQQKIEQKLLFLNYEINKVNDVRSISLINQIKTDGKLKIKNSAHSYTNIGDLEYLILDQDLSPLETHSIQNPLRKTVEFINDSGEFEKKTLDLNQAQFSLKLQLQPRAKYVVINEITTKGIIKLSTTTIE